MNKSHKKIYKELFFVHSISFIYLFIHETFGILFATLANLCFFFYQPASFFVIIVDDLNEEKPGNKELYKDSGLSSMTFCFFNLTLLNC